MSLVQRKPRPLARDPASLRDDRLFIVACDDTYAPKQYLISSGSRVSKFMWSQLDTDHYTEGRHLPSFIAALSEARRQGVNVALSKPCFELWLLLHHVAESELGALPDAMSVAAGLRAELGHYNKTSLKAADCPLASVSNARIRTHRLDGTVAGGEVPSSNTSRVYLLWKAIAAKALPSQLPPGLRGLLP
jgi:hypothetical protein